jgi:hypothetical protein
MRFGVELELDFLPSSNSPSLQKYAERLSRISAQALLLFGSVACNPSEVARNLILYTYCPNNQTGDDCRVCRLIQGQNFIDVRWVSLTAKTGTIESIRQLISSIQHGPVESDYLTIWVDHIENLNAAAANALLKSLEEPPAGVQFVLTTTDIHSILPTIRSRCLEIAIPNLDQIPLNSPSRTQALAKTKFPEISASNWPSFFDFQKLSVAEQTSEIPKLFSSREVTEIILTGWAQELWQKSDIETAIRLFEFIPRIQINTNIRLQLDSLFISLREAQS